MPVDGRRRVDEDGRATSIGSHHRDRAEGRYEEEQHGAHHDHDIVGILGGGIQEEDKKKKKKKGGDTSQGRK